MRLLLLTGVVLAGLFTTGVSTAADVYLGEKIAVHQMQVQEWRAARHDRLSSPTGWLTLVGLDWLQEGKNTIGSSDTADIIIPGGPEIWGTLNLEGDALRFDFAGNSVSVDMVADKDGTPTKLTSGTVSFHTIYRESYGIRMQDSQAPELLAFEGVENYPIEYNWRIEAEFTEAEPGTTLQIGNVLGQLIDMAVLGTIEFEADGKKHQMIGLAEPSSENVWFIFSDRTSGRETYGAGRFLYSDGMPEDGKLVVDFNKAYNPPCAFNEYSTCPLPPQENRVDVAIRAGEKKYH